MIAHYIIFPPDLRDSIEPLVAREGNRATCLQSSPNESAASIANRLRQQATEVKAVFFCEVTRRRVADVRSLLGIECKQQEGFRASGRKARRKKNNAIDALRRWLQSLPMPPAVKQGEAAQVTIARPTEAPKPVVTLQNMAGHYDRLTFTQKTRKGARRLRAERYASLFNALAFLGEWTSSTAKSTLEDALAAFQWPYPGEGPQIELAKTGGDWTWSYKISGAQERVDTQQHLSIGQGTERSKCVRIYFADYVYQNKRWIHIFYAGPHPQKGTKRFRVGPLPPR